MIKLYVFVLAFLFGLVIVFPTSELYIQMVELTPFGIRFIRVGYLIASVIFAAIMTHIIFSKEDDNEKPN